VTLAIREWKAVLKHITTTRCRMGEYKGKKKKGRKKEIKKKEKV
jgi:hypothetical protein